MNLMKTERKNNSANLNNLLNAVTKMTESSVSFDLPVVKIILLLIDSSQYLTTNPSLTALKVSH